MGCRPITFRITIFRGKGVKALRCPFDDQAGIFQWLHVGGAVKHVADNLAGSAFAEDFNRGVG